jgi:hypothetical protein
VTLCLEQGQSDGPDVGCAKQRSRHEYYNNNSARDFTLGATVRMRLYPEGDDWSYRLLVEERWTCMTANRVAM